MKVFVSFRPLVTRLSLNAAPTALALCAVFSGGDAIARNFKWAPPPHTQTQAPSTLSTDMQLLLNEHNNDRAKHCTPPLTWSQKVAADAQAKANTCGFFHNSTELQQLGEGENLYWGSGSFAPAKAATDSWYGEITNYNFSAPVWSSANGHFTQMVWKDSTQLGCGTKVCNMNGYVGTFWVCRYSPPGNMNVNNPANLRANVAPPCK